MFLYTDSEFQKSAVALARNMNMNFQVILLNCKAHQQSRLQERLWNFEWPQLHFSNVLGTGQWLWPLEVETF